MTEGWHGLLDQILILKLHLTHISPWYHFVWWPKFDPSCFAQVRRNPSSVSQPIPCLMVLTLPLFCCRRRLGLRNRFLPCRTGNELLLDFAVKNRESGHRLSQYTACNESSKVFGFVEAKSVTNCFCLSSGRIKTNWFQTWFTIGIMLAERLRLHSTTPKRQRYAYVNYPLFHSCKSASERMSISNARLKHYCGTRF